MGNAFEGMFSAIIGMFLLVIAIVAVIGYVIGNISHSTEEYDASKYKTKCTSYNKQGECAIFVIKPIS